MRHAALRTTAAGLFAGLFAAVASGQGAPAQTLNDSFDSTAPINPVLEWNQIFIDTLIATSPPNIAGPRLGAIVQAAVFDAYNGIEQRYAPLFVARRAPDGASREAAVVAAAYTTLVGLFPSQQAAVLDPAYGASIEALRERCPTGPRPNGAASARRASRMASTGAPTSRTRSWPCAPTTASAAATRPSSAARPSVSGGRRRRRSDR